MYPLIAPPTEPQLNEDKRLIDESFEKAFSLLDQLAKDTESLKASEQARTERLDSALTEVESVIGELKTASKRREDESRRITDEVRGLKDLIPRAMEGQKEATDTRLRELNTELKSLKTLMGQRMNPVVSRTGSFGNTTPVGTGSSPSVNGNTTAAAEAVIPKPASVSNTAGTESIASLQGRSSSPFSTGALPGRAAIPSWQLKSASSSGSGSGSQDATAAP